MTKTANKRAIRQLPRLRASLIWFKRETVRRLRERSREVSSSRLRAAYIEKAVRLRAADLADLRTAYQCDRVGEICKARRFELSQAVPGIAWLTAALDA